MEFPVISYFGGAFAELEGKSIWIPTLNSTAVLLIIQGADGVIVPPLGNNDGLKSVIQGLPPSLRAKVRIIDSKQSILKRVTNFIEPISQSVEKEKEMSPEQTLARCSIPFLYQLALAAKYGAGMTDGWIDQLTHLVHESDFNKFKGAEARYRTAQLVSLITSYRPFLSSRTGLRGNAADPGIRGRFSDILETSEYADVVSTSGHLGLVRQPTVALRRLRRAVVNITSSPKFRSVAEASMAISALAQVQLPAEPLVRMAGDFEVGNKFSPPIIDTSRFLVDIYKSTLNAYNPRCRPPKGGMVEMHVHQPAVCGAMELDITKERKAYDPTDHQRRLLSCHLTAQEAALRFLKTNK